MNRMEIILGKINKSTGIYYKNIYVDGKCFLLIKRDNRIERYLIQESTEIEKPFSHSDFITVYWERSGKMKICKIVVSNKLIEKVCINEEVNIIDEIIYISNYINMNQQLQKNIDTQLNSKEKVSNSIKKANFNDISSLKLKYLICKNTYPCYMREAIESLFDQYNKKSGSNKEKVFMQLKYLLTYTFNNEHNADLDVNKIKKEIDKRIYGMDLEKERFLEILTSYQQSKNVNTKGLLFVGPAGTAKTTLSKVLAECTNRPWGEVACNGIVSTLDLFGCSAHYDSGDIGLLTSLIVNDLQTTEAIVVLDEIDKMATDSKDGNPYNALLKLFSESMLHDAFLPVPIDVSNTIFIATANSIENIPNYLINRFEVIEVSGYSINDKCNIALNYTLPQLYDKYSLTNKIVFNRKILNYIATEYTGDQGMREMSRFLEIIIQKIIKKEYINSIKITYSMVDEFLYKYKDKNRIGIIYNKNEKYYDENIKKEIERIRKDLLKTNISEQERQVLQKRIRYLLNCRNITIKQKNIATNLKEKLDELIYGMNDMKNNIIIELVSSQYAKKNKYTNYLLVGKPGVGKTAFSLAVSNSLDIPSSVISLNGIFNPASIKGYSKMYQNGDAGLIVKSISKMKSINGLLVLDEIDKIGKNGNHDVENALLDMLDNSGKFYDEFLEVNINLTGTMFIATANSTKNISPILLDRFQIININNYTEEDKYYITKNYLIPKITKRYNLENNLLFDETAILLILTNYLDSPGIRSLENGVEKIVKTIIFQKQDKLYKNKYLVSFDDIKEILGYREKILQKFCN